MNETHIMPEGYDGAKHISTTDCPCRPTLETKDPDIMAVQTETAGETWLHRNY